MPSTITSKINVDLKQQTNFGPTTSFLPSTNFQENDRTTSTGKAAKISNQQTQQKHRGNLFKTNKKHPAARSETPKRKKARPNRNGPNRNGGKKPPRGLLTLEATNLGWSLADWNVVPPAVVLARAESLALQTPPKKKSRWKLKDAIN